MSDGWNPVREEFFKRTLSRDFKTIYQRQLDIAKRDLRIYNRQIWGIVYNNALPDLRAGMSDSLRKEIRNRLEKLFPWPDGNDSAHRPGYRPH